MNTNDYRAIISRLHELIPDGEQGNVRIDTFTVNDADVEKAKMRALFSGSYAEYRGFKAGTYKRLVIDGRIMMSNTEMEVSTNLGVIRNATGRVLIAGLGLGMILFPMQEKEDVTEIVVLEKNPNVIDLVAPHLGEKVKVVECDIFEYEPEGKFDVIYFDIWFDISADNWEEMKTLTKKFKYALNRKNPLCWMSSWRKEDVQRMYRIEQKEEKERRSWDVLLNSL